MKWISHSKPAIDQNDIHKISELLTLGRLADSSEVALFEKQLSTYIGHKDGIATNSGTNALYLALLSLGSDDKDEVIIPSYVCSALLNAIYSANLKPAIVDINKQGYNISIDGIKKAVNRRTKAIIAPHMFGDPINNIKEINDLGLPVIEDCALSVGAAIDGRKIGSYSLLSVFSFYATKVFTTGHGGMVLSSSEEILNKLRDLMQYDNRKEYRHSFNFRLTDFQAALGRNQLCKLNDFIAKRKKIADNYNRSFCDIKNIKVPCRAEESIYFRYIVEVENANKYIERISHHGIDCRKPVSKPLHQYLDLDKKEYPNTERAYKQNVSIPIYPAMTECEVKYVIDGISAG